MTIRRKLAIFILSSVKKWVEKGDVGPEPSKNTGCGNNLVWRAPKKCWTFNGVSPVKQEK